MELHGSDQGFGAAAIRREFPALADPRLHYLDNAATAQMPEVVLGALRRFEVEARSNVHEGVHRLARAAPGGYDEGRSRVAPAFSTPIPSRKSSSLTAPLPRSISWPFPSAHYSSPAMKSCCRFSSITATLCPGRSSPSGAASCCVFCR